MSQGLERLVRVDHNAVHDLVEHVTKMAKDDFKDFHKRLAYATEVDYFRKAVNELELSVHADPKQLFAQMVAYNPDDAKLKPEDCFDNCIAAIFAEIVITDWEYIGQTYFNWEPSVTFAVRPLNNKQKQIISGRCKDGSSMNQGLIQYGFVCAGLVELNGFKVGDEELELKFHHDKHLGLKVVTEEVYNAIDPQLSAQIMLAVTEASGLGNKEKKDQDFTFDSVTRSKTASDAVETKKPKGNASTGVKTDSSPLEKSEPAAVK